MSSNQTPLQLMFSDLSQQQGLERMMMIYVSLANNEYGTGQEPQLRRCGAWLAVQNRTPVVPRRFDSERKLRSKEER